MSAIVWFEGRIINPNEPIIGGLNHGFTVGDGIFESITLRGGKPFALDRHLARLQESLVRIGLVDLDPASVVAGLRAVVEAGQGKLTRLRITVTAGAGPLGTGRAPGRPTIVIAGADGVLPHVCSAIRVPWRRNEYSPLVGLKTTSAGDTVVIRAYAESRGADEALLANSQGHLCEGTTTNVFIEHRGEIVTPPIASGCLPGVTRALALEWGVAAGIPVRAAEVGELEYEVLDDVLRGEAFAAVTSVTRGVQPVSTLDGTPTNPGPLLAHLREVFENRANLEAAGTPPPR